MQKRAAIVTALMVLAVLMAPGVRAEEQERPKVEVIFVLDTTGSMSELIEGAKLKIWKIVNQIVSGKPVPDVRVGLIGYRDRGDGYVTKVAPLSTDLDAIYNVLIKFKAKGGGDRPESVNQALHEGLTLPAWSRDDRTLRLLFLVGDAPPKMNYPDDVKYPVTCEKAARAGVIINTIQCGADRETAKIWQEIARLAEGRYVQVDQSGGMAAIDTPFDKRLAELSDKLSGGALFYGDRELRDRARRTLSDAEKELDDAPAEAKAERAGFLAKSGRVAAADLLSLLERGDLKLADLDEKLLPETIRKLAPEARVAHLEKLLTERKVLREELLVLDKNRAEHIKVELGKAGGKDAFDERVLDALREQAARIGVKYE